MRQKIHFTKYFMTLSTFNEFVKVTLIIVIVTVIDLSKVSKTKNKRILMTVIIQNNFP